MTTKTIHKAYKFASTLIRNNAKCLKRGLPYEDNLASLTKLKKQAEVKWLTEVNS